MADPLITATELASRLNETVVCDIRWRLTDPSAGRSLYLDAHIPGAVFVDLDKDLSAPPGVTGRHPLPSGEAFLETLSRLGISEDSDVVVYDDVSGMVAARMWWMLRSMGHSSIRLLDGGFDKWVDGGHETSSGDQAPKPAKYAGSDADFAGAVGMEDLVGRQLVDVRANERYTGEVEPVDPRPGHIPGALNLPAGTLLENGQLRPAEELRTILSDLNDPVMACGSGVNASFMALAHEVAFGSIPDVYPGSYSEWSRSTRPVHTGDRP